MAEDHTNQQPQQPPQPAAPQGFDAQQSQAYAQGQAQPFAQSQPYGQAQAQQPYGQAQAQQPYGQPSAHQYAQPGCGQQYYAPAAQPVYAAPASRKKNMTPWIVLGVILFAVVFCFTIGAMSCSSAVHSLSNFGMGSVEEGLTDGPTVAVIDISGTIQYDGTACSPEGLSSLLDQAEENDDIEAVVLRVDSGGGTATAGEEMAEYVKRFSKPVVVSSASMNCSAAYEISSQADLIYVNKTTDIGAIGTVMQVTDLSELLDKLGISVDNIASAESKDSSYGTRPLTDEERAYYQELIDVTNEVFVENVAEGRSMSLDAARALATGLPFTGEQAVENGLADEVGVFDDAIEAAAQLAGLGSDYNVITLTQSSDLGSLMDLLSESDSDSATSAAAAKLIELLKNEGVLS